MRRMFQLLAIVGLSLGFALAGHAGDDTALKIVEKATKAHFPKGLDTKKTGTRTKAKGKLHVMGLDLDFTQEISVQAPNKFKESMDLDVMGMTINVITVFNGKEAWIQSGGKEVKVTAEILEELKGAADSLRLMQGVFTKEKGVKFALLGDSKVRGKDTVGVTVSREGKKDINLFFDKTTHLISKVEMRRKDLMSGQEVTEERFITEYQELNGQKVAKKVEVLRDGKALLEAEVTDVQTFDKLDDTEFAQPK